ncbi:hypothetical protein NECID01_2096 [Nematocida sp. AWRm77]|nr:hypothetical protein NECID01_2096 [Nematocida sp. AWRm77]
MLYDHPTKKIALIIEGFKQDRANYIYSLFKSFFEHLNMLVHHVNLEGLSLSLLNPQYRGVTPSEAECKELFSYLGAITEQSSEQFIMVCDTLTEPYERREAYFAQEYSVETNSVFILECKELPEVREDLGLKPEDNLHVKDIVGRFAKICLFESEESLPSSTLGASLKELCKDREKKSLEKTSILLSTIKKNLIMHQKAKIFQGIYLHSKYSTLYLLHTGHTVFYVVCSELLHLVTKILAKISLKKKWSVYLCPHYRPDQESKKEVVRVLKNEAMFRKELKIFCEKEKIGCALYSNDMYRGVLSGIEEISKVKASVLSMSSHNKTRDLIESLVLIEGLDKTLVVSSPLIIKTLISYIKRTSTEDILKQTAQVHSVIKLSVKGTEVEEKRFFLASSN